MYANKGLSENYEHGDVFLGLMTFQDKNELRPGTTPFKFWRDHSRSIFAMNYG